MTLHNSSITLQGLEKNKTYTTKTEKAVLFVKQYAPLTSYRWVILPRHWASVPIHWVWARELRIFLKPEMHLFRPVQTRIIYCYMNEWLIHDDLKNPPIQTRQRISFLYVMG